MSKVITKSNFNEEVINSDKPILVDFFSKSCGPCRMLAPVLDAIAEETTDFYVGKVCVEDELPLALEFSISVVPTLLVFKEGKCLETFTGYRNKEEILKIMEQFI